MRLTAACMCSYLLSLVSVLVRIKLSTVVITARLMPELLLPDKWFDMKPQ